MSVVATPVLALIVGITLIGLPVAVFTVLLWLAGLYLAKIVLAVFLGRVLLASRADRGARVPAALIVGLILILVTVNLPDVGILTNILLTVIGLGAVVIEGIRWYRGPVGGVQTTA